MPQSTYAKSAGPNSIPTPAYAQVKLVYRKGLWDQISANLEQKGLTPRMVFESGLRNYGIHIELLSNIAVQGMAINDLLTNMLVRLAAAGEEDVVAQEATPDRPQHGPSDIRKQGPDLSQYRDDGNETIVKHKSDPNIVIKKTVYDGDSLKTKWIARFRNGVKDGGEKVFNRDGSLLVENRWILGDLKETKCYSGRE